MKNCIKKKKKNVIVLHYLSFLNVSRDHINGLRQSISLETYKPATNALDL